MKNHAKLYHHFTNAYEHLLKCQFDVKAKDEAELDRILEKLAAFIRRTKASE